MLHACLTHIWISLHLIYTSLDITELCTNYIYIHTITIYTVQLLMYIHAITVSHYI